MSAGCWARSETRSTCETRPCCSSSPTTRPGASTPSWMPSTRRGLRAAAERWLGTGLRALAARARGIPVVQAHLVLPAPRPRATSADRAKQLVLAETLLSGTQRRDSVEVAEALQRMGGRLDASIDSEDARLRGSALSPSLG